MPILLTQECVLVGVLPGILSEAEDAAQCFNPSLCPRIVLQVRMSGSAIGPEMPAADRAPIVHGLRCSNALRAFAGAAHVPCGYRSALPRL